MDGLAGRHSRPLARALLAIATALALGCASTPEPPAPRAFPTHDARAAEPTGVVHVLQRGENLYRLSRHYGVSVDAISRANGIRDPRRLQIGQRIWIPGMRRGSAPRPVLASFIPSPPGVHRATRETGLDLQWPVDGKLSSRFGRRHGQRHDGVDIPARRGTPIRAAEAGRVIHSGRGLGAYGNVVIVKHVGRYSTVYAHNQRNRVRKGDFVEKGQVIGEVGTSGNASGPHVHFEVRRDSVAIDPLPHLP